MNAPLYRWGLLLWPIGFPITPCTLVSGPICLKLYKSNKSVTVGCPGADITPASIEPKVRNPPNFALSILDIKPFSPMTIPIIGTYNVIWSVIQQCKTSKDTDMTNNKRTYNKRNFYEGLPQRGSQISSGAKNWEVIILQIVHIDSITCSSCSLIWFTRYQQFTHFDRLDIIYKRQIPRFQGPIKKTKYTKQY